VRPVLSVAEMGAADAAATVPVGVLIERSGRAVAGAALRLLGGGYGRRIVIVAGKGNNGADGRAARRTLVGRGAQVSVVDAGGGLLLPPADLVIDAAYGTGLRRAYEAPDPAGAPVLAIDVPSGLDGDSGVACGGAVHAAMTVTMAALKPGLLLNDGPAHAGRIEVADIGLDVGEPRAHLIEDADIGSLPARPSASHKWSRAVWIVAGSPGMTGAADLCARAAQRSGAGMIHVGSPDLSASAHPAAEAVAIGLPASEWDTVVLADLSRFAALIVGPGLGRRESTASAVRRLVASAGVATVVDADGLHALGSVESAAAVIAARPTSAPVVLTPHEGEFAGLAGRKPQADRMAAVRDLAARTGAVVLLKGATTVVAAPSGEVFLATAGDARLATAGTGDVLSGIIGAFLAAGLSGLVAAGLAAHVHGLAARRGPRVGLVAGDLPDLIPGVLSVGSG